tara:strand:+ start:1922 stop:2089 length:168 start_codon:yes stop_codon:yes gene_type:complete
MLDLICIFATSDRIFNVGGVFLEIVKVVLGSIALIMISNCPFGSQLIDKELLISF